jgi:alpha-tubulin suppressor-like RCC1 family protein
LTGATKAVLDLKSLQDNQAGIYSVVVSNAFGVVTSPDALLTTLPLAITIPPRGHSGLVGETVTFRVTAYGVSPLSLQWRFNDMPLTTETGSTLILTNAQLSQAGQYSVTVSNALSSITSSDVPLTLALIACWGSDASGQTNVPKGLTNIVAVAAGNTHILALNADGTVSAWGDTTAGQTNIPPGLANVVAIAGGGSESLALKGDGTVVAWGDNTYGQTNVPPVLTNVLAIAAGGRHALALKVDGTVVAWGDNTYNQTNVPLSLTNAIAIAAGDLHSLALTADGQIVGWGNNWYGQASASVATNFVGIAAGGNHSLALKYDGTVVAWGDLVALQGLTNVAAIAAGGTHDLALTSNGMVVAWGKNDFGQTNVPTGVSNVVAIAAGGGDSLALVGGGPRTVNGAPFLTVRLVNGFTLIGTTVRFQIDAEGTQPLNYQWRFNGTDISGATNASLSLSNVQATQQGFYSVLVSNAFGIALSSDVHLSVAPFLITVPPQSQMAWVGGSATFDITVQSALPLSYQWRFNGVDLPGATNIALILTDLRLGQAGPYSVVVSNAFGSITNQDVALSISTMQVAAWGGDFYGQTTVPAAVTNILTLAGGYYHTLALLADGSVIAWGYNGSGQTNVPQGLGTVAAIAAGWGHSLALTMDGKVVAWGDDFYGQIDVPADLTNGVALAAGWGHSLALTKEGRVVAWGWNAYGQTSISATLTNVTAIAAGHSHNLALNADGTVIAWGADDYGQTDVPSGLRNVVAVAVGWNHSLALKRDGTVVGWGWDAYGQTDVPGGLTNVVGISGGRQHSLALKLDGTIAAWGDDSYGQTDVPPTLPETVAILAGGYHSLALFDSGIAPLLWKPNLGKNSFSLLSWTFLRKSYSLEFKNSLTQSNWTSLPDITGHGTMTTFPDTNAQTSQRFFRVRVH